MIRLWLRAAGLLFLFVVTCSILQISEATATQTAGAHPDCSAREYHDFDFWAGHYLARDKAGVLQGHTSVDSILGGCVLQEHFVSAVDSQSGTSLSFYDRRTKQYVHFWVDSWGNTIELRGSLSGSSMLMMGRRLDEHGRQLLERTRWTPVDSRTIRQVWDFSADGGRTWANRIDWILTKQQPSMMRNALPSE